MNGYLNVLAIILSALVSLVPGLMSLVTGSQTAPEAAQTVRRTLQWRGPDGRRVFELSNVNGSVRIVGEDRSDVSIVAARTVLRESPSGEPAPQMDFREESGRLLVCGDASHCGCHIDWPRDRRRRDDERAKVRVDFEVRVPRGATLDVCAVNGGTVRVDGAEGPYTLRNVNGDLEMVRMRGAGEASTVNGDLDASFAAAPTGRSAFKTVNGHVNVTLPSALSADLRLKTLNGGLYTDFETTPLPSAAKAERENGRFVYRADRHASVRVGAGGPELTFETLNGDVQVRKEK
jgi:hypothetical protein